MPRGGAKWSLSAHLPTLSHKTRRHVWNTEIISICGRARPGGRSGGAVRPLSTTSTPKSQTCVKYQDHLALCARTPSGALRGRCAPAFHRPHTKLAEMCERSGSSHFVYEHSEGALRGALRGARSGRCCAPAYHHPHAKLAYMWERRGPSHVVYAHAQGAPKGHCPPTSTTVTPN
jgi:hypothetical protein